MKTSKRWTDEEINTVVSLYPNMSNEDIANKIGRTKVQVEHVGKRLKLRKSKEYWKSLATPHFKSKSTPFKKGQRSIRKGVKLTEEQKAKMTSMFKPGHKSWQHNYPDEIVKATYALRNLKKAINGNNKRLT